MKRPLPRVLPCENLDELQRQGININTATIGIALKKFFPQLDLQALPPAEKKSKARRRSGRENLEERIQLAYDALAAEQRMLRGKALRDVLRGKLKEIFGIRSIHDRTFQRHGY